MEPVLIEYTENAVGREFTIAVKIVDVANLYGFDMKFRWNTTFLEYVNHSVCVPRDTFLDGVLWNPTLPLADEVDTTERTYWISYASMAPAPSFNGTGTVFTMTFKVIYHPVQPEPDANITLELYSTDLAAKGGNPISHTREHGTVILHQIVLSVPALPVLKVMPIKTEKLPTNSSFNIDIWILGVNQSYDIANLSITLNFNSTLIRAMSITEGPWPKSYAEDSIQLLRQINNVNGTVTYAIGLVSRKPEPPTTGILFTVTFQVIYESLIYPPPSSELTLDPTDIIDRTLGPIPHTSENGTYTANRPPPVAKFTPSTGYFLRGQTIIFNASESYHPLGIKLYTWDFGDGNKTTVTIPIITHVYKAAATVTVVLNVTDYGNFWSTTSAMLYIIESQTVPQISVVNSLTENNNFTFYTNTTSVGSRFNATVLVYDVANLYGYQVRLEYNSTLLNATRAWLPTWDPKWVFYGKSPTGLPPSFGTNYVKIGDMIMGAYPTFSGAGIVSIIEFEIIYAPTTGKASSNLDINNADTLLLDPSANEISSAKTNGHYQYIYVQPEAQPTDTVPYVVAGTVTITIIVAVAIYIIKIRKPR